MSLGEGRSRGTLPSKSAASESGDARGFRAGPEIRDLPIPIRFGPTLFARRVPESRRTSEREHPGEKL